MDGKDKYAEFRHRILPQYNKYIDGDSAKRVLDAIGIKK